MRNNDYSLSVRELSKRYGEAVAVDRLSFDVAPGTIFGLLGPNGAGKTTTLECIEGLRSPDDGEIRVMDINPASHPRRLSSVIGVQLQESGLPATMTVGEALQFFSRYHGVPVPAGILEQFGLADRQGVQYGNLSTGQRRRLALALAVSHGPRVLFLDEPTAGLDVQSRADLHGLIQELRRAGTSIILSTHDMAEAEKLCDRIGIIIRGQLVIEGTPSRITAAGDSRTRIRVSSARASVTNAESDFAGATRLESEDGYAAFWSDAPAESVAAILAFLKENGDELIDLRVERPSLEERFIELMTENARSIA